MLGNKESLVTAPWPSADLSKSVESMVKIAVQVNGKVRAVFEQSSNLGEEESVKIARKLDDVKKWIEGKPVKKVIYVKNRLINFVLE